jgi:hypothetical protein
MLLLWIGGCHWFPPAVTTTTGMGGTVRDAAGSPVVGLKIENLESSVLTDDEGRFGLHYKRPETYVTFAWLDVSYRRAYRPEDDGLPVALSLPTTRALTVDCGAQACALTLDWALTEGLAARWDGRCDAGGTATIQGAPHGDPAVTCRPSVTEPPVSLTTRIVGDHLELLPPARSVGITIVGDDLPGDCAAYVDGEQAAVVSAHRFGAQVIGAGWASAVCDHRWAAPVHLNPDAVDVAVPWASAGPELQPDPALQLDRLQLVLEGEGGWTLHARAAPSGGFLLPPLPAGRYAIQLHGGEPAVVPVAAQVDLPPGRVVGHRLASGQYAASLVLEHELGDGLLRTEGGE